MNLELTDKVALVTGASRGIGRAIARLLNDEGCRLALVGRRKHLLHEVAEELAKTTDKTSLVLAEDITAPDAAARIKSAVLESFGRLDILINNCGRFSTDRRWIRFTTRMGRRHAPQFRRWAQSYPRLDWNDAGAKIRANHQPNRK